MGDVVKLKALQKGRSRGTVSKLDLELCSNMFGRNLTAIVEGELTSGSMIYFKNGGDDPVASFELGSKVATMYPQNCGDDKNALRYYHGLECAGFRVEGYAPRTEN